MRPEVTPFWSDCFFWWREMLSSIRHFSSRWKMRRRARSLRFVKGPEPFLNYGKIGNAIVKGLPIGGEIKLLHLQQRYPSRDQANLIYLVSSAIPSNAEEIVSRGRELGMRLIWNQNGVAYPGCYGDFYPWFNRRMTALYAQADYVIFQSDFSRISAERYLGTPYAPWEICFNPVDVSIFTPRNVPIPSEPWQILAAGTSHAFYRTRAVLETLRELLNRKHSVHLTIAGEFRWRGGRDEVARYIENYKLGAHVSILPPFRQPEAPDIYRRAHVLIHSKYNDPCPTVPIEAMACGLPVVGSKSGGMPELVPDDCGILAQVSQGWARDLAPDAAEMADAVEMIMAKRECFSAAARNHAVNTFALEPWLNRHETLFRKLLG